MANAKKKIVAHVQNTVAMPSGKPSTLEPDDFCFESVELIATAAPIEAGALARLSATKA